VFDEQLTPIGANDDSTRTMSNERNTTSAPKNETYKLFVLGELMDGPHHGYGLREILSKMLGPFRQMSWGVLYPLIRQLERERLIESIAETDAEQSSHVSSGKHRKYYRITKNGQERFRALMLERDDYTADYPELFTIKLNNFDHISREEQLTILWDYRGYLQVVDFYLQGGQQYVTTNANVPENQRAHILRTISYRMSNIQAELSWIDQEIARLENKQEK
jgi:DNA-binding PadR family transcriptional regulator